MNKTTTETDILSTQSPAIVLLLCIFLGNFGIHRFYVGKIGTTVFFIKYNLIKENKEWKIQAFELKRIESSEQKNEP